MLLKLLAKEDGHFWSTCSCENRCACDVWLMGIFCCTDGAVNSKWKEIGNVLKNATQKKNQSPDELQIKTTPQKSSGEGSEKQLWGLRSQWKLSNKIRADRETGEYRWLMHTGEKAAVWQWSWQKALLCFTRLCEELFSLEIFGVTYCLFLS